MFDFPSSPSNGQMFTPVAGGPSYVFQTPVWRLAPGGVNSGVWVGDAPPSSPSQGTLWWESDSGNTFIYYDDGSSGQWVQFNSAPPPAGFVPITAEARNRIVNGAAQFNQELGGDVGTTTSVAYFMDQWRLQNLGLTCGAQRQSTTPSQITGNPYRASFNVNTAKGSLAAGDLGNIFTHIEGNRIADFQWGTAQAKQAVLAFTVRAPVAGTYHVAFQNADNTRSFVAAYTISAGEVGVDVSRTIVVPGDTTGTWVKDTGIGLTIYFVWAAGSTYNNAALGWQAGSKYATSVQVNMAAALQQGHITDVGLYLDPDKTGLAPKWQAPDYAAELLACQRYWVKHLNLTASGIATGASQTIFFDTILSTPMRVSPAVNVSNTSNGNSTGVANSGTTTTHLRLTCAASAAGAFWSQNDTALSARM